MMQADDGVDAGEAAIGAIRRVELLDLGNRRPAAVEVSQPPDQLQVGEVPRRQGVGIAAAVQREALHRPGADVAPGQEARIGAGIGGVAAPTGNVAGDLPQGDRPPRRKVGRLELGRGAAGDHRGAGNVV